MTPPVETAKRIGRGHARSRGTGCSSSSSGWSAPPATSSTWRCSPSLNGPLNVHYIVAAILAFCVAVTNNFWWNRHWTFDAKHGHAGFQAARFFTVSVLGAGRST